MILAPQFFRFAQVGVAGFVVDWACLSFFLWAKLDFFAARGLSYICAATATWALNRIWTFADTAPPLLRQWGKFISANAFGGTINYGISVILIMQLPRIVGDYPVLAVAAGSLSGLFVNYALSKRLVFTRHSRYEISSGITCKSETPSDLNPR